MTETPLLQLRGITKTFGSVQALTDIDFEVRHGEVMALVGDNGAGKSTLIKCIAGTHAADSGEILFEGKPVSIHGPKDAAKLGIEVVYQDLALCDNLDVVQNMYLGREEHDWFQRLQRAAMEQQTATTLKSLAVTTIRSIRQPVATLSGRSATVGRRRAGRAVELEARDPRRADRRPRRRADRAGARARPAAGGAGPLGRDHLPQPARHLRDREPHHRSPPRPERRRLRAREDDPAGGRRGDHRRRADEGLRHSRRPRRQRLRDDADDAAVVGQDKDAGPERGAERPGRLRTARHRQHQVGQPRSPARSSSGSSSSSSSSASRRRTSSPPVNFVNIIIQMAGTAMLAYGVVFVLLLGEIDLSISYVAGIGAVAVAELQAPGSGHQINGLLAMLSRSRHLRRDRRGAGLDRRVRRRSLLRRDARRLPDLAGRDPADSSRQPGSIIIQDRWINYTASYGFSHGRLDHRRGRSPASTRSWCSAA